MTCHPAVVDQPERAGSSHVTSVCVDVDVTINGRGRTNEKKQQQKKRELRMMKLKRKGADHFHVVLLWRHGRAAN